MASTLAAGDKVVDYTLKDTAGVVRSSAEARANGLLLYAFYKRTCGTCQYALPFLQRFQDYYAGKGFQIWGVAQENAGDAADFAQEYGATFPQLVDSALDVTEKYDLVSVPGVYLVDRSDGILRSASAFVVDELNAISQLVAERTGQSYRPVVSEADGAPAIKPG